MQSIPVTLSSGSYEICVGGGLFGDLRNRLDRAGLRESCLFVTQPKILSALVRFFDPKLPIVEIPEGERAKTLTTVSHLIDAMAEHRLTRQSAIIAVGGGVVGDVAGFAASIYMRGVAVVQVPTTLLAQVDSSIGGKTGVNHRLGKNLIGTFHQPRLVLADSALLRTLPDREYANGLFEALKYGVISDPVLFGDIENRIDKLLRREESDVQNLVYRCAAIKARVVMADEKESDLRRTLNFGHTIGHSLETAANYKGIKHGEAVGYGMIAASRLAERMGKLQERERARIEAAVRSIGRLPKLPGIRTRTVLDALQHDKKVRDGAIHFILPTAIGQVEVVRDAPPDLIHDAVKEILDEAQADR